MPSSPPPPPIDPFRSPLAGWVPSGAHDLDRQEIGDRIGAWYEAHEGLRSAGPSEGAYEAFIFPNDTAAFRRDAADHMWSCALRLEACERLLGVPHHLLSVPYALRLGRAVADAAQVARSYGALVEDAELDGYEPGAGDAMCQLGPYGPHVSCIVRAEWQTSVGGAAPRLELACVDGGQGRPGDMAIGRTAYVWTPGRVTPKAGGPSRRLLWVVNMWRLVRDSGLLSA